MVHWGMRVQFCNFFLEGMLCIRFLLQPVDNDSDDFVMASPKKDSARRKLSLGRKYSVIKFKLLLGLHASFIKVH